MTTLEIIPESSETASASFSAGFSTYPSQQGEVRSATPHEHRTTVFVVDDDKAVRESLRWLLESVGLNVETYASADEFLARYVLDTAGCLVVDVRLPGMSGLDLQQTLNQRDVRVPVIVITGHGDVPVAVRAMKAGAVDFIEKPFSDQTLLDRVRYAIDLDQQRRTELQEEMTVRQRLDRLTPREREVMQMVVAGKLNKQIASDLGLSHKTIEVHRAHVMEKMEADSVATLVRMAMVLDRRNGHRPPPAPDVAA